MRTEVVDGTGFQTPVTPKADLLIVDDNPANLRLLSGMLVENGYKVRSAINGALALMAAQNAPPDMVLLDINMPGMSGYEVCQRLKDDERVRDIPVIFISALDATSDKVRAFDTGAVDYVAKPFHVEEVLARVETHLSLRRLQQNLERTNVRLQEELRLAGDVQASFLPSRLPDLPGWRLAATLIPARETSGDFYDFFPLEGGNYGFVVADVSDKGTAAALFMALSRTLLRTYAPENVMQPELAFHAAHQRILGDTNTRQFVTVFYGILDPSSGALTYANAGHNPPFLFRGGNRQDIQELPNTGPPLGLRMFTDLAWDQGTALLERGDTLVLYSDGITEAQNTQEDFFDDKRLLEVVRTNIGRSAQEIQDAILDAVRSFVGRAPQADDITLLVLVRD
jgi:sigma-B regulation protein RsbU (phosphoserine phosphatase)